MVLILLLLLFILIVYELYYFVSRVFGRMERVTEFPERMVHLDATPIVMPKCI